MKTPYYITRTDGQPLAFAGLWDTWTGGDGAPLHTCAIVTTHADGEIADLHPRMPVMLPNGLWDVWLDRGERDAARLKALLDDVPAPDLDARAVSTAVNDVGNDGPELIVPRADPPPPPSPR